MEINIDDLVKPAEKNGRLIAHQDPTEEGLNRSLCSTFIAKRNILIKGEWENEHEKNRSAILVLFDCESGDIVGWPKE